jgi:DNA-binding response OmpR family regulator
MSLARILVIEDDALFRGVLADNLAYEGYDVHAVGDGDAALTYVRTVMVDLVILDLTLPDVDGLTLCPLLRGGRSVPIVVLSARGQRTDKLKALGLGADDYITKPTDLEELMARIKAVLRRSRPMVDRLILGRVVVDFQTQQVTSRRKTVNLSPHELRLLRYLAEHREQVVRREDLLAEVWGYLDPHVTTRTVDQAIFRLRQKIERDPRHPVFIRTAHWDGYTLTVPDQRPEPKSRHGTTRDT